MSQENVEIVRRIYEEINVRLEFPREWFAPDCVTDWTDVAPDAGLLEGVDATNAMIASYFGTFENFYVVAEEIVFADQERVVTEIRDGGLMRDSNKEITSRYFHAWTFRDGKVVRLSSHTDRRQALKAVGLAG
jgi:ketosteroid isomerase-like protein